MRFPEWKIKQALLHPEEELRAVAAAYFADGFIPDRTVMPLVIEAVEKYGSHNSARLMREAQFLPQTERTIDWLLRRLSRAAKSLRISESNFLFAAALALVRAPLHLIERRQLELARLRRFPEILRRPLEDRFLLSGADWDMASACLIRFGEPTLARRRLTKFDRLAGDALVEALSRHREKRETNVLVMLQRRHTSGILRWLEPLFVQLAGEMRLAAAVPMLVDRLAGEDELIRDEASVALARIGSLHTIDLIAEQWECFSPDSRMAACEVLERLPTDLSLKATLRLINDRKEDRLVRLFLGHALLGQFAAEGIAPVRLLVFRRDLEPDADQFDLRYRLVAVSRILGESFPELKDWSRDAARCNWGWSEAPARFEWEYRDGLAN